MSTVPRLDATCKCTKSVERFWFYDSRLHVSYWWSLGLCFCLQYLHSTFLKGHSAGLQEQSLSTSHIAAAQRVSSAFVRFSLSRTWQPFQQGFDAWKRTHTPPSGQPRGRMISQLAEALEPQGASGSTEAAEDSSSSTGPLGHQNSDKFNFLSLIWVPDHTQGGWAVCGLMWCSHWD